MCNAAEGLARALGELAAWRVFLIVMLQASLRLRDYNLNSEGLVSDKFGYLLMGMCRARLRLLAGASSVLWSDVQRSLKTSVF